jgi:hypothetical protein
MDQKMLRFIAKAVGGMRLAQKMFRGVAVLHRRRCIAGRKAAELDRFQLEQTDIGQFAAVSAPRVPRSASEPGLLEVVSGHVFGVHKLGSHCGRESPARKIKPRP